MDSFVIGTIIELCFFLSAENDNNAINLIILKLLFICLCLSQGGTVTAKKLDSFLERIGMKLEEKELDDLIQNLQRNGKSLISLGCCLNTTSLTLISSPFLYGMAAMLSLCS